MVLCGLGRLIFQIPVPALLYIVSFLRLTLCLPCCCLLASWLGCCFLDRLHCILMCSHRFLRCTCGLVCRICGSLSLFGRCRGIYATRHVFTCTICYTCSGSCFPHVIVIFRETICRHTDAHLYQAHGASCSSRHAYKYALHRLAAHLPPKCIGVARRNVCCRLNGCLLVKDNLYSPATGTSHVRLVQQCGTTLYHYTLMRETPLASQRFVTIVVHSIS